MKRFNPILPFLLTFLVGGAIAVAPATADEAKAEAGKADGAKGGQKAPVPGGPDDKDARWWNDSGVVEALSLTDEQRKKIDEHLKTYRDAVPKNRGLDVFHEALVQGDWKAAQTEINKVASEAEKGIQLRGALKVGVLSVMSDEQRQSLVDRYPRLIYKPWTRAMRGGAAR